MIGIDALRLFGRVQRALGVDVWLNLARRGRWRVRVDRRLSFLGHEWFSSRHNVGVRSLTSISGSRIHSGLDPTGDLPHDCSV
jgi:hypothetical protein